MKNLNGGVAAAKWSRRPDALRYELGAVRWAVNG